MLVSKVLPSPTATFNGKEAANITATDSTQIKTMMSRTGGKASQHSREKSDNYSIR